MLEQKLEKLGFGKNEVKVYLALFDLGKCKAKQIIDNTGLHRNLVYTALDDLIGKKLISKVESNGIFLFWVNSPELLNEIIEEKAITAKEVIEQLKKKSASQPREILIYEGEEGVKKSRTKVLTYGKGDTFYMLGTKASFSPSMEKFSKEFDSLRIKKGIYSKILVEHDVNKDELKHLNKMPLSEAKHLPLDLEMPIWFSVIQDYLEIGIPGVDPLIFSIKNKAVAGAIKKFIDFFWNQESEVVTGAKALQEIMLESIDYGELKGIGAKGNFFENYPGFFNDIKKRAVMKQGLVWRNIVDPSMKGHEITKFLWTKTKYNLSDTKNPNVVWLYGPKAVIINWADKEPVMFVSTNKALVQSYNDYFEEMWGKD
ncbi:MAG: helix-turn-helix domain-containing protein [Candidatus Magasanikbacteria bacterium]